MGDVIKLHDGIGEEQHEEHHRLIEEVKPLLIEFLEDRRRARELREKFRQSAVGAVAVMVVGAVGSALVWIGQQVIETLGRGHHP